MKEKERGKEVEEVELTSPGIMSKRFISPGSGVARSSPVFVPLRKTDTDNVMKRWLYLREII